jgi:hypothetical protein
MPNLTLSIHVGSRFSIKHNKRLILGEEHIDYNKSKNNYILEQVSKESVYETLFSESLETYNSKMTRSDRMIDYKVKGKPNGRKIMKYMEKMKGKPREAIIQLGNSRDGVDKNLKVEMLRDYYKDFKRNNPNLQVIGAYLHLDEADPHLHIDFVPWFENSGKGANRLVGFDKALAQQLGRTYVRVHEDVNDKKIRRVDYSPYFTDWRKNNNQLLSQIVVAKGFTPVEAELRRKAHLSTQEYRRLMSFVNDAQSSLKDAKDKGIQIQSEFEDIKLKNSDMELVLETVEDIAQNGTPVDLAILNEFAREYWLFRDQNKTVFESIMNTIEGLKGKVQSIVSDIRGWFENQFNQRDRY